MEYTKDVTYSILYADSKKKKSKGNVIFLATTITLLFILSGVDFILLSNFIQILKIC